MNNPGGVEVLQWTEHADPIPGENEVLIEVVAIGVNFRDIYFRRGMYSAPPNFILGQEAAGLVISVGAAVTQFKAGDRVVAMLSNGAYAERVTATAGQVAHVPDAISLEEAASIELQGLTAHVITTSCSRIKPGDWIGVHAAAGGLGLLLTQIAKHKGAHVIGTVSSKAKAKAAERAGADIVVGYDAFVATALSQTKGRGLDAVYDGVGSATFRNSLEVLTSTGTLVLFGWVSGPVASIELDSMKSRTFVRPRLNEFLEKSEFSRRIAEIFAWMETGVLKTTIGARFALRDAGKAQDALESRQVTGKVLLVRSGLSDRAIANGE